MNLPVATHSNSISDYFDWLKEHTRDMQYGEVGLTMVIHAGDVVRIKKIETVTCRPS